jgi:hypothetical protein
VSSRPPRRRSARRAERAAELGNTRLNSRHLAAGRCCAAAPGLSNGNSGDTRLNSRRRQPPQLRESIGAASTRAARDGTVFVAQSYSEASPHRRQPLFFPCSYRPFPVGLSRGRRFMRLLRILAAGCLAGAVATPAAACCVSEYGAPRTGPVHEVVHRIAREALTCGGAPTRAIMDAACERRNRLMAHAQRLGWCWGSRSGRAVELELYWLPCRRNRNWAWYDHR